MIELFGSFFEIFSKTTEVAFAISTKYKVRGVVSGYGQRGIGGARVEFHKKGLEEPISSPRSAADGRYAVELKPGNYSISVELEGGKRLENVMSRKIRYEERVDIHLNVSVSAIAGEEADEGTHAAEARAAGPAHQINT